MEKNTDSKYYIPSESITSNCYVMKTDFTAPENARFSSNYDDFRFFKCQNNLNFLGQATWLSKCQ